MTDASSPTPPDRPARRRRKRPPRRARPAGDVTALPPVIRVEIQNLDRLAARDPGADLEPGREERLRAAERALSKRQALLDAAAVELAAREDAARAREEELEAREREHASLPPLPEGGDLELRERARTLDERERDLEARRAILEADLELREEEVERRESGLAERQERLDERERELGLYVSQIQGQLESRSTGW
jgi:hypothetical protein